MLRGPLSFWGGYHASLAYAELTEGTEHPFDYLIRGEGERALPSLINSLEGKLDLATVPGLSFLRDGAFRHNSTGELLDVQRLPLPDRSARVLDNFTYFNRKLDCVETSRGCTMPCSFCSITGYGSSFRCYSIDRVIRDLKLLQARGTQTVLLVDDNITLDATRFRKIAEAIVENGMDSNRQSR